MKIKSLCPVLVAFVVIGSALCQTAEELPVPVETDNQFPPEHSESEIQGEDSETIAVVPLESTADSTTSNVPSPTLTKDEQVVAEIPAEESFQTTLETQKIEEAQGIEIKSGADSDSKAVEASQITLESQKSNEPSSTSTTQYVQLDSDADRDTAAAKASQITSESHNLDDVSSTATTQGVQANSDTDSHISAAEPSQIILESQNANDTPSTSAAHDDQVDSGADSDNTAEEHLQITLESQKTDVALPTLSTQDDQANSSPNNESAAAALSEKISESTLADAGEDSTKLESETILADDAAPGIENNYEQVSQNEDSEIKAAESTQTISEAANNGEQDSNNNQAIEAIAAESTITDIVAPTFITKHERDISQIEGESMPSQPIEEISGSTTLDVSARLLASEDIINNEGSKTTIAEPTQTTSSAAPIVTINSQETDTENRETTVIESTTTTTESPDSVVDAPKLENTESQCPEPCICITEGDSSSDYIVDCSGHGLTELPTPIDPKTTSLKLESNQFTKIPKTISNLKNLKNLYANDNLISELESGSISELPELISLNLANNNLQEYPKDLENTSNLDKLEELNLSGNELKLAPEIFLNLKALQTITLREAPSDLVSNLCTVKESLSSVCIKSCSEHLFKCSQGRSDATLPGLIPYIPETEKEKSDIPKPTSSPEAAETPDTTETKETSIIEPLPETASSSEAKEIPSEPQVSEKQSETKVEFPLRTTESKELEPPGGTESKETPVIVPLPEILSTSVTNEIPLEPPTTTTTVPEKSSDTKDDFPLRNAVNNAPQENIAVHSSVIEAPKDFSKAINETDVKVGAKTTETKGSGGVDKSVIAIIVAGMVIIIAVITIKKNWSSIRKRFSSSPRPNERSGRNTNGTTIPPEEVPLQDKSPV